jgi:hypothetical protein
MSINHVSPKDKLRYKIRAYLNQFTYEKKKQIQDAIIRDLNISIHGFNYIVAKTFNDSSHASLHQLEVIARHLGVTVEDLYATPPEGAIPNNRTTTYVR